MATRSLAPLVAAALLACGTPRPATPAARPAAPAAPRLPQAGALEGSWALRAVEPGRRGPRLQLAIDSARDSTFRTRVTFLMQGDVGLDPTRFAPTRGTVAPDGTVHLTVRLTGRSEPTGRLAGTLAASRDTIRLVTFEWGGANATAGGVHWLLVRQP